MKLPDTTTVLNRTGRIVITSILAGMFASIGVLFTEALDIHGYSSHIVTEPIDLYFAFAGNTAEGTVLFSAILAVGMPVYWLLTRRFSPKVVLTSAFLLTTALVLIFSYFDPSTTLYETVVETIGRVWIAASVFAAVAFVERASKYDVLAGLSLREGVTTMGVLVVASLALVFLTVGGANVGVAAVDAAGITPSEPTPDGGMSPDEFNAEYGSLPAAETGSDLTCSESHLEGTDPAMPVSETHWNDLSAWSADVRISNGLDEQERNLRINLTNPDAGSLVMVKLHEDDADDFSTTSTYTEGSLGFEETGVDFLAAESHDSIRNNPLELDDLSVDIYVVNPDGEVVRYTGNLCGGANE